MPVERQCTFVLALETGSHEALLPYADFCQQDEIESHGPESKQGFLDGLKQEGCEDGIECECGKGSCRNCWRGSSRRVKGTLWPVGGRETPAAQSMDYIQIW